MAAMVVALVKRDDVYLVAAMVLVPVAGVVPRVRAHVVPVPLVFVAAFVVPVVVLVTPVVALYFVVAASPVRVPTLIATAPLFPAVASVVGIVAMRSGVRPAATTAGLKWWCSGDSADEGEGSEDGFNEHFGSLLQSFETKGSIVVLKVFEREDD